MCWFGREVKMQDTVLIPGLMTTGSYARCSRRRLGMDMNLVDARCHGLHVIAGSGSNKRFSTSYLVVQYEQIISSHICWLDKSFVHTISCGSSAQYVSLGWIQSNPWYHLVAIAETFIFDPIGLCEKHFFRDYLWNQEPPFQAPASAQITWTSLWLTKIKH